MATKKHFLQLPNYKSITVLIFLSFSNLHISAQQKGKLEKESFGLLFYNTENFYDILNDPKTDDDEFLPTSKRYWTKKRLQTKIENLYRAIISASAEPPSIIGLAEIENFYVLNQLAEQTPLSKFEYGIIHFNSPDARGIDVGMLYRKSKFKPLKKEPIRIVFPFDTARKTRDILYVKGIASQTDTIHIFINHWPSRRGGQSESDQYRLFVAKRLRQVIDSIFKTNSNAKMVIMGDFNDEPDNESIREGLGLNSSTNLVNLSQQWQKNTSQLGTHKFKGKWGILDQVIVSGALLDKGNKGLLCKSSDAHIVNSTFLLTDDPVDSGLKPFKTYNGYKYTGGFSDHLPIILILKKRE